MKRIGNKLDRYNPKFYTILRHNSLLGSLGYTECDWWWFANKIDSSREFRSVTVWDLSEGSEENPIIRNLRIEKN